jgi:post-segregation antitoxin (ccd killing protein)
MYTMGVVANVTIYLPDELHHLVKAASIPVSRVCQRALLAEITSQAEGSLPRPLAGQMSINDARADEK